MLKGQPEYLSYLLRLWRASGAGELDGMGGKAVWRASLESTRTGERRGFAGLNGVFDFLQEQTRERVEEQPGYVSYLLRLWREDGIWRASLESARTGELSTFANLAELFEDLRGRCFRAEYG
jgi:hypothetical protein